MITEHLHQDARGRYPAVDIIRGAAILMMLAANASPTCLVAPHGLFVRAYGSFAAPVFIFLAGFMVAAKVNRAPSYFMRRGFEVVAIGVLIDLLVWRIVPFTSFDVLYLIGLGIPVAAVTTKWRLAPRLLTCGMFLVGAPMLQSIFGYSDAIYEFGLKRFSDSSIYSASLLKSWLIDGWFPVFPWMGILLAGTLAVTEGAAILKYWQYALATGSVVLLAGTMALNATPPLEHRHGYSEFFYPPNCSYLVAAIGVLLISVALLGVIKPSFGLQWLGHLGSCSMIVYVAHAIVIRFLFGELKTLQGLALHEFALLYLAFGVVMILCSWCLLQLRGTSRWARLPQGVRFLLGG